MSKRKSKVKAEAKAELDKEIELDNIVRDFEKIDNVLAFVEAHLEAQGKVNAALHCDEEVVFSTLHNRVLASREDIKLALKKLRHKVGKKDLLDEGTEG